MKKFNKWLEAFDTKSFKWMDMPEKPKERDVEQEMRHLKQALGIEKAMKALIATARDEGVTPEIEDKAIYMYDRLAEIDPIGARYWRKELDKVGIDTSYPEDTYW